MIPELPHHSVRDLRRRWKPHKHRMTALHENHPTNIRFHRACSWLDRGRKGVEQDDLDVALLAHWLAFNSLYGQWDAAAREPLPDRQCWRQFIDRLLRLDSHAIISGVLQDCKPLVCALLEDEYLSRHFWKDPCPDEARRSRSKGHSAQNWFLDGNWLRVLEEILNRVYLLRSQLAHGAATCQGKLNRVSLKCCATMMAHLVPALLTVWTENGADEDWGELCYPPQHNGAMVRR